MSERIPAPGPLGPKLLHMAVAALLLLAAAVQFNDPDPLYWVLVYGLAGLFAFGMALGRSNRLAMAMLMGATLGGIVQSLPGMLTFVGAGEPAALFTGMSADRPWVEETREGLGLLLVTLILGFYLRRAAPT